MINLGSFLSVNPLNVLPPSEEYLYFKEEQRESTTGEMCGQGMLLTSQVYKDQAMSHCSSAP